MIVSVTIEGDHLDELTEIMAGIRTTEPDNPITAAEWIQNLVINTLEERIRGEFIREVQTAPLADIQQKLGNFKDLRANRRRAGR